MFKLFRSFLRSDLGTCARIVTPAMDSEQMVVAAAVAVALAEVSLVPVLDPLFRRAEKRLTWPSVKPWLGRSVLPFGSPRRCLLSGKGQLRVARDVRECHVAGSDRKSGLAVFWGRGGLKMEGNIMLELGSV